MELISAGNLMLQGKKTLLLYSTKGCISISVP